MLGTSRTDRSEAGKPEKPKEPQEEQSKRFIETARELGVDEAEAAQELGKVGMKKSKKARRQKMTPQPRP